MRRQFDLPEADVEFLDSMGLPWETLKESQQLWLIIHEYSIPDGYNILKASIALLLTGYPTSQIDMASFDPPLNRKDGITIPNLSPTPIDGKQFQQWSRHRTGQNPWLVGEDDIQAHLHMFNYLLAKELTR